jgi:hypothetical protein
MIVPSVRFYLNPKDADYLIGPYTAVCGSGAAFFAHHPSHP